MTAPLQAGTPDPAPNTAQPAHAHPASKTTSLDHTQLARWRFTETNGFVIKDYTGLERGSEPVIFVVKSADVFEVMADAMENHKKISVYAVGPCVLDLS